MKKILTTLAFSLPLLLLPVSCLKEGDDTLTLPPYPLEDKPTTGYGDGSVPAEFLPDTIRAEFLSLMPIHEGKYPPAVAGQFLASLHTVVFCTDSTLHQGDTLDDWYLEFYDQTDSGMCKFNRRSTTDSGANGSTSSDSGVNGSTSSDSGANGRRLAATSHIDTVYLVGQGDKFTAFLKERVEMGDAASSWCLFSTLISGVVTPDGIRDFHNATILIDKYDPDSLYTPVGGYRVSKDADGLADTLVWNVK